MTAVLERPAQQTGPADRPVRDCQHTTIRHEHGTTEGYRRDGCRCPACTAAEAAAGRAYALASYQGTANSLRSAAASARHLRALRAAYGVSDTAIGRLLGKPDASIWRIRMGLTEQVLRDTEAAVLALSIDDFPPSTQVHALGARRRLQALATLGWGCSDLEAQTGVPMSSLAYLRRGRGAALPLGRHRAIAAAYRRLENAPRPTLTVTDRRRAGRARRDAAVHGWPPPAAWDNPDTDDRPHQWKDTTS